MRKEQLEGENQKPFLKAWSTHINCVFKVQYGDPRLRDCSKYFSKAMAREELYGGINSKELNKQNCNKKRYSEMRIGQPRI